MIEKSYLFKNTVKRITDTDFLKIVHWQKKVQTTVIDRISLFNNRQYFDISTGRALWFLGYPCPRPHNPGSYIRKEEWFAKRTSLQGQPAPGDGDPENGPTIQKKAFGFLFCCHFETQIFPAVQCVSTCITADERLKEGGGGRVKEGGGGESRPSQHISSLLNSIKDK